jgi:hypothetical protein
VDSPRLRPTGRERDRYIEEVAQEARRQETRFWIGMLEGWRDRLDPSDEDDFWWTNYLNREIKRLRRTSASASL